MRFCRKLFVLAAAVAPCALASLPVWAEEAGGEKGGLPQLDASLYPEQIFWLVVTFVLLYMLMSAIALPRVAKVQKNRKKVITTEIETARAANERAKASVLSTEKALIDARAKGQSNVAEMLAKVNEEASEIRATRERELLRKLRRAEEGIATACTSALEEIHASADALAKDIIAKILDVKNQVKA